MYIKIHFKLLIAILITSASTSAAYLVWAQTSSRQDIAFPVAELNNCKSETECKTYCNNPENIDACVSFAEKHGLISADEASKARGFKDVIQGSGPGGCKNQDQCETYCNNQIHMDECISFAEKHNLMLPSDLAEAKKINQALKEGAKLPGNCQGKQQCEAYCKSPDHAEECIDFAAKAGFIPPDQVDQARKISDLVKSGDAPKACLEGKDQCQTYCSEESHRDQCANFMVKAGFIKPEDAEIFKKTGGKGPGNCQSKEECNAFCSKQENQKTCFEFGKDNGMIPADQLKEIQESSEKIKESLNSAPPEVKQCLQSNVNSDILQKINSGTFFPTKDTGEQLGQQMQKCFKDFLPKNMPGQGPPGGSGQLESSGQNQNEAPRGNYQFRGPGGCSNLEECVKYCADPNHTKECGSFRGEYQQGFPEKNQGQPESGSQPNFQPPVMQQEQRPPSPSQIQQQFQEQYKQQYQQYQEQFQKQFRGQYQQNSNPPVQGVPPAIIKEGMTNPESNYNPNTNSPSGAQGIMQPMPQGTPLLPPSVPPQQGAGALTPAPLPGNAVPAPAPSAPPSSNLLQYSPFGAILNFFLGK